MERLWRYLIKWELTGDAVEVNSFVNFNVRGYNFQSNASVTERGSPQYTPL